MSQRVFLASIALALGSAACVIVDHNGNPQGGFRAELDINFAGEADCFAAGVDTVTVSFADNSLQSVSVPCNSASGIAVVYEDVDLGTYNATMEGLSGGAVVYAGQGSFTVAGDQSNVFTFNLLAATSTPTQPTVELDFEFGAPNSNAAGMTCKQAQATNVAVVFDSGTPQTVPCTDPTTGMDSAVFTGISAGTHTITATVTDSQGNTLYEGTLTDVTIASGSNVFTFNLDGQTKGGLELQWFLTDPSNAMNGLSCSAAGVTQIAYTLLDPTGAEIAQGMAPCADNTGANSYIDFDQTTGMALDAGVYSLKSMTGLDANNNVVYSSGGPVGELYVPAGALQAFQIPLTQ